MVVVVVGGFFWWKFWSNFVIFKWKTDLFIHIYFHILTSFCKNSDVLFGAGSHAKTPATFRSLHIKLDKFCYRLTDEKLWTRASSVCWINSYFSALQLCPFTGCPPCQQLLSLEQARPVWFWLGDSWSLHVFSAAPALFQGRWHKFHQQEIPGTKRASRIPLARARLNFSLLGAIFRLKLQSVGKSSFWINCIYFFFWCRAWICLVFGQ